MNSMGMRPAPAPCKEPVPFAFRPRSDANTRSITILVDPESRTKEKGFDPLMRTGTKIIPLRHSKAKVDALPWSAKMALPVRSEACALDTRNHRECDDRQGQSENRTKSTNHIGNPRTAIDQPHCPLTDLYPASTPTSSPAHQHKSSGCRELLPAPLSSLLRRHRTCLERSTCEPGPNVRTTGRDAFARFPGK